MELSPMLKTETPARVSCVQFARFAWFVLAYNLAVILWGAFVRASGSGAGCGNHWPLCGGQLSPAFATLATVIEFLHRATSGIDLVLVAALTVWAFRAFPSGHPARLGAALSAVFLLTEALIGAALVLLEHVAKNQSASRGYSLSTHLINTLTLLACLTLTAWWGMGKPAVRLRSPAAFAAAASLLAVMLLGVTGAIAALADTLFPAASLAAGLAQDFNPAANIFLRLRGLHPVLAAGVGTWLLVFAAGAVRIPAARQMALAVIGLVMAQLAAGLLNMLLLAPVWLQMVHLLVADGLWIALVLLCAAMLGESGGLRAL
jgi:heme A synthase